MTATAVLSDPVLFEERTTANGKIIGIATLNAEKTLNSLNMEMIPLLTTRLEEWRHNKAVVCVVLQGAGEKAFCAGGDVKFLYDSMREFDTEHNSKAEAFFTSEYTLDYTIHTYPKPILCWGSGIVMGGGIGMMVGASHRVVTETSRLAMPEITIGLYPDVAGSWFLNRMPGRVGLYLGLTGAPLNAADTLFVKLADFCLCNDKKETVLDALPSLSWREDSRENHALLSNLLREHREETYPAESAIQKHFDTIQRVTDYNTTTEIVEAILQEQSEDKWITRGQSSLKNGSPTTAYIVHEIYQKHAKHLSLKEVFQLELIVSMGFTRHPDFAEGVRALLIDKDNQPQWTPPTLEKVTPEWVEEHFQSPWTVENHPLRHL